MPDAGWRRRWALAAWVETAEALTGRGVAEGCAWQAALNLALAIPVDGAGAGAAVERPLDVTWGATARWLQPDGRTALATATAERAIAVWQVARTGASSGRAQLTPPQRLGCARHAWHAQAALAGLRLELGRVREAHDELAALVLRVRAGAGRTTKRRSDVRT